MKVGKVQFKVNVDERIRDIVAMHASQNNTNMSATVAKVVEEVLFPELNAEGLAEVKAKAKMREDAARATPEQMFGTHGAVVGGHASD